MITIRATGRHTISSHSEVARIFSVKKTTSCRLFSPLSTPVLLMVIDRTGEVVEILTWYLFRELTYPTYGKGKSSSQLPVKGLEGTVFSLWILVEILRFSASMCKNILFEFPQRWDEIWNAVFQNQESKAQEFKQFSFHIYLCTTYIYVCMHACDFT